MSEKSPIQCPLCDSAIKHIPAGVSKKSGKPYSEFWACISRDCQFTWKPIAKTATQAVSESEKIIQALRQIYAEIELLKAGQAKIIKQLEELETRSVIYPDKNEKEL